jgi:glycosyltransferase involved in cell wall biosynthesis
MVRIIQNNFREPLLSIAIATRNRIPYAISAIDSILAIPDDRLELVVQDNSDSRELESYVKSNIKDSRFRYRYTPPPFSSIDNFNAVIDLAQGEYVCMIGDDDGINPDILKAARWARKYNYDSLSIKTSSFYLWPDTGLSSTAFTKVEGGSLSIQQFTGKVLESEPEKELRSLLKNGGLYYLDYKLPKIYHGLVRRSCLNEVKNITGNYFAGLSPDIYGSVSLSCVVDRVAYVDYPLTIAGHCRVAEETHHIKNAHLRPLSQAPHFRDRGEYKWSELVPEIFIGEAIWVDSAIAALKDMGRDDLIRELNLPKLAAHCTGGYSGITYSSLSAMYKGLRLTRKSIVFGTLQFAVGLFLGPGLKLFKRVGNRLLLITRIRKKYELGGIKDINECSKSLSDHLLAKGVSRRYIEFLNM